MSWLRLDDGFSRHPKVLAVGAEAAWLYVCGLCYSGQFLTDGHIPHGALPGLAAVRKPRELVGRLVAVGLWHETPTGWQIHDYLAFNPSRGHVEEERQKARERRANGGRASGERRANVGNTSGDVHEPRPEGSNEPFGKGAPKEKASRIPDEFVVTPTMVEWANTNCPGVNWRAETAQFVDYWKAEAGQKARKMDWGRAWKTWMRRAVKFQHR